MGFINKQNDGRYMVLNPECKLLGFKTSDWIEGLYPATIRNLYCSRTEDVYVMRPWVIEDATQLARENPRTFFIPSPEDIKLIKPGNSVKLIFCSTKPEVPFNERMWVMVKSANDGHFMGYLNNIPFTYGLAYGDLIEFEDKHIIAIDYDCNDRSDLYFKDCLVSPSVLEDGALPCLIDWTPPEDEVFSGWCVIAENEEGNLDNFEDLVCARVGEVVYHDNTFEHLLFLEKDTTYYWDDVEQSWTESEED
jgi:hypothetical protein